MVKLALPILSTKNFPFAKAGKGNFQVIDSGKTQFPNDPTPTTFLDVIPEGQDTRFRFALNWSNEKNLAGLGVEDTEEIHGRTVEISVEATTYKNQPTKGLRITALIEQEKIE